MIEWKQFLWYWPFVQGSHQSLVNSPHKGPWHRALMFSLICAWTNAWGNNLISSDLRRHHIHYDVTVIKHQANTLNNVDLSSKVFCGSCQWGPATIIWGQLHEEEIPQSSIDKIWLKITCLQISFKPPRGQRVNGIRYIDMTGFPGSRWILLSSF